MTKRIPAKRVATISLAVLLAAAIVLVVLEKTGVTDLYSTKPDIQARDNANINYSPPTSDEQQAADEQKDRVVQEEEKRNDTIDPSKKNANVVITDAAQYDNVIEVRSFVSDHYQDGTCDIIFIQGDHKVAKSTPAYRDASTTICTNPLFNRSEFPASGEWQVTVTYSSVNATGTSKSQSVTIR